MHTPEMWDLLDEHGNKTGGLHERGKPLSKHDLFLTVHVWIVNARNEFLITRRTPHRNHLWHTTGGCAQAGDDSITSAIKETREEIGLDLNAADAAFFTRVKVKRIADDGYMFQDAWLFRQNVDISMLVFQADEVCDAMWASVDVIKGMIADKTFVNPSEWYPYLDELFESL